MYQLLDTGFIGLIFSCFNEDVHKVSVSSWGPEVQLPYTLCKPSARKFELVNVMSGRKNPGHSIPVTGREAKFHARACFSDPCN